MDEVESKAVADVAPTMGWVGGKSLVRGDLSMSDLMPVHQAATWEQLLNNREVSSAEILWRYVERIVRWDQDGPQLNAVAEMNPDAMSIAEALDQERNLGKIRGPLHGIPVMIKDNIATADKMHTTAGTLALAHVRTPFDAHLVARLRDAGAIIFGKTNLTELANFMSDHMPNGYSARGGQVRNPYGPGRLDTGGSSAGSGVAVAAEFTPLAIGTETSGSILSPSSQNSIVGLKPSIGVVSRAGIVPIAHSQDTAGPMVPTVRDAALLLSVIAGPDPSDPVTLSSPFPDGHDFTQYLNADNLSRVRLGLIGGTYRDDWSDEDAALMMRAVKDLRGLGAEVVEDVTLPNHDFSYDVLLYEFKVGLNAYLQQLGPEVAVRTLGDIIQFNHRHAERALRYGQSVLLAAEATRGTLIESRYWRSRQHDLKWSRTDGLDRAMSDNQLDAVLFYGNYGADIAARAGYPSITVPAGYRTDGKPVGLTFAGLRFSEPTLLRLAYVYEQKSQRRQLPEL